MNPLREMLLKAYNDTNAANVTVFGFYMNDRRDVYAVKLPELPNDMIVMSCESSDRGKVKKLKVGTMSDTRRTKLLTMGAVYVGTSAEVFGDAKNRGDAFEAYIARKWYGKADHKKESVAYWKQADIDAGTEQVSVKFEAASLATETTIRNGLEALNG